MTNSKAMLLGVIGDPVSHSRSPRLHGYWIKKLGMDAKYTAIRIDPVVLEKRLRELISEGYRGVNVTIPHKETVMAICDSVEPLAKEVGAVNTLLFEGNKIVGRNTDAYGFSENLKSQCDLKKYKEHALVVGAGGAARGVCVALVKEGFKKISITNRTDARAVELSRHVKGVDVVGWERRHGALADVSLLVNTTNQGMAGETPLDLSLNLLGKGALVTDIVYNPLVTPLLKEAAGRGNVTVDGIGMLIYQGQKSFQYFTGVLPEVTKELRDYVLK